MNLTILTGRLTRDTELSNTQGGIGYLRNAIAVKSDFKNKDGEYQTDFYNFCAFGKTAEMLAKYCSKGSLILIKGHLTTNFIMNDKQQKCTTIELIADSVDFLETKKQENGDYSNNNNQNNAYYNNNNSNNQPFPDVEIKSDISSDDLPF